jgi:hypothetical protein
LRLDLRDDIADVLCGYGARSRIVETRPDTNRGTQGLVSRADLAEELRDVQLCV